MKRLTSLLRWRNIRLPSKLVLVFMPLIILPALTGIYLVTTSYTSSSKQMTTQYATDLLGLMVQKIDDRLRGYEQLSKQLMTDEELHKLLVQKADTPYDQFRIGNEINNKINVLWLGDEQNKYIRSIKFDTPNGIYTYGQNAVDDYGITDAGYRQQVEAMKGSAAWVPPQRFTDGYRELEAFRLGRTIRDEKLNTLGSMTFVIDVQAIASIFGQAQFQDELVLQLLAPDGQVMLGNGHALDPGEKNILAFSEESIHNGWRLSAQLPLCQLYKPIYATSRLSVVIVLACIGLGLAVTQLLALDLVIPIRKLMTNMKHGIKGVKPGDLRTFKGAVEIIEMNDTFISVMYEIDQLIKQVVRHEQKKKDAEIRMLQNQLSPHFMYNTLNSIRWMAMIQKQDNIKEMIDSMNRLLTHAVRGSGEPVPLREELAILNDYINIQKVRYQHVALELEVPPELTDALVLKFLLQPLIENALVHGLAGADRSGLIRIEAREEEGKLVITVSDNGVGMTPDQLDEANRMLQARDHSGAHIGLCSVHERIQLHYGEAYGMTIASSPQNGTAISLSMPERRAPRETEEPLCATS